MTDTNEPAPVAETTATGLGEILDQSPSAPAQAEQITTPEPANDIAAPEAKPAAEQPFWYRKEAEKLRKRAQAAEQEAERLRQSQTQPQNLPDPRQDPVGHFETMRVMDRLERSEDRFIDKHGEQEFDACKEWLATRPDIEAWAVQQRHPWAAAHQQYQREKLSAEIGDDPNAWRDKERERLRAEIQAEFQAAPMARPNIPAPASGQRSAAPRGGDGRFAGPTPLGNILKG